MADEPIPYSGPIVTRAEAKAAGLGRYFTGKPCSSGHKRERYTKSGNCLGCQETANLGSAQYYLANKAKIDARSAETRASDPDRRKRYYAANREKQKADAAAWRTANPDRLKATAAAHYAKSGEKRSAYYAANKDRLLARGARWKAENPDKRSAHNANRRARIRGAGGSFTAEAVAEILKLQKERCAHSWCRVSLSGGFHRDHIISLAKGGLNVRTNLQLLCRSCNLKKFTKHPIDFARENGMLL